MNKAFEPLVLSDDKRRFSYANRNVGVRVGFTVTQDHSIIVCETRGKAPKQKEQRLDFYEWLRMGAKIKDLV